VFLELGDHPPANAFLRQDQLALPEARFPLDAHVCLDCALIQVPDQLPAGFFRDYVYVPSAADTMHSHFAGFARAVSGRIGPGRKGLVVDIGCNDGLFLDACRNEGLTTLGIEPAANIAAIARGKGLEVVNEFFGPATSAQIRAQYGPARVISTTNTFNHIDDLHAFMEGVVTLLDSEGTFIIEVPQALTCVEQNEFDTIYHEHLSVFSLASLVALGGFFGMEVVDVAPLPIHGGSMRVYLERRRDGVPSNGIAEEWVDREHQAGLFKHQAYDALAGRVRRIRDELLALLRNLKGGGKRLAGYGAPAKGNTLLNYYGIGPELLEFLADRNPLKQNKYSPGMHILVVSPEEIARRRPDYLLILAWNFAEEIMEQQARFRADGGRFILPIPEPRIVE
jgi:hypothetical protein